MAKTIGIYLRPETEKDLSARGENRSYVIARDLDRLYSLYRRAIREVPLTEREACLLVDALNGVLIDAATAPFSLQANIEDSIIIDRLAEKWDVDGPALIEKLRGLNAIQSMALVDGAERFWVIADEVDVEEGVRKIFNISD